MKIGHGWYEDHIDEGHDIQDELRELATNLLEDKLEEVFSYKAIGVNGGRYYG